MSKRLIHNQRLYAEYEKSLASLTLRFPNISFSIAEPTLAANIETVVESVGFNSTPPPPQNPKAIIMAVAGWLKRNRLILLHYHPGDSKVTIIDVLRGIKKLAPNASTSNLVPIIMGDIRGGKQGQILKVLGAFGVRYAIFLEHGADRTERNIERILEGLHAYGKLLKSNFKDAVKPLTTKTPPDTSKIAQYKENLIEGERLMKIGKFEEAILKFTKAILIKPDFNVLMKRGDAFYRKEDYISALGDYREANKLEKGKADPYAKISACCFSIAKEVIKTDGEQKAKQWFAAGMKNLRTACAVTEEIVQKAKGRPEEFPASPYANILAAITDADIRALGLEEEEAQLARITEAVMTKTNDTDYLDAAMDIDERLNKARLLVRNRQYAEAEKIYRQIVKEDGENVGPAFNNFAVELRKNGQYAKAFAIYTELLGYDVPDRDIITRNLETAGMRFIGELKQRGKIEDARTIARKIVTFKQKVAN